jgi:hypothetical protein
MISVLLALETPSDWRLGVCCWVSCFKDFEVKGYVMTGLRCSGRFLLVLPLLILLVCALSTVAVAQGLPESLGPGNPSNDCGCPRGDNAIPVSSGMLSPFLPKIPNLELGFLYSFGKNVRTGRFTADYLLPFRLNPDSVLFGEAHAEGWDFWKKPSVSLATAPGFTTTTSESNNRVDLSFGGGYRTMLGVGTLVGVNGFYDASRLFNKWYSSGGVGLEMAATVGGDDAIDLNFNWYGNLFNRDVLVNAFRNKGNSFDVEAGYSHALFDHAMDLRLKLIGYQFDIGTPVQGWRGGADLTTRNGMFTLRCEHGQDRIQGDYNTVGGFVNVGFQLENLLRGESPFTMPQPVFRSPRDLRRMLGQKVKRNWHQPEAVIRARNVRQRVSENAGKCVVPLNTFSFDGSESRPDGVRVLEIGLTPPIPPATDVAYIHLTMEWFGLSINISSSLFGFFVAGPDEQYIADQSHGLFFVMTSLDHPVWHTAYDGYLYPTYFMPGGTSRIMLSCMLPGGHCSDEPLLFFRVRGVMTVYVYADCP